MKSPRCPLCEHGTLVDEDGREVDDEFIVGDYECPACGYSSAWSERDDIGDLVELLEKLDGVRIQFADLLYEANFWTPSQKSGRMMEYQTTGQSHDNDRLLTDAWGDIKRAQQEYPEAFEVPVEGASSAALLVEKFERAESGDPSTRMFFESVVPAMDFRQRALETKAVFDRVHEGVAAAIRRRLEDGETDRTGPTATEGRLEDVELPEAPTVDIPILGALERALR